MSISRSSTSLTVYHVTVSISTLLLQLSGMLQLPVVYHLTWLSLTITRCVRAAFIKRILYCIAAIYFSVYSGKAALVLEVMVYARFHYDVKQRSLQD